MNGMLSQTVDPSAPFKGLQCRMSRPVTATISSAAVQNIFELVACSRTS
jgi:hypothetical protein